MTVKDSPWPWLRVVELELKLVTVGSEWTVKVREPLAALKPFESVRLTLTV